MSDDHSEVYIDFEGEQRCATCDKWLERDYYAIDDHCRSMHRRSVCICGHPHSCHPLPGRMPGVNCERCYRCTGWRQADTTFDNGRPDV